MKDKHVSRYSLYNHAHLEDQHKDRVGFTSKELRKEHPAKGNSSDTATVKCIYVNINGMQTII
jgi:hypothetical protein